MPVVIPTPTATPMPTPTPKPSSTQVSVLGLLVTTIGGFRIEGGQPARMP
jgi:hypothetical protein